MRNFRHHLFILLFGLLVTACQTTGPSHLVGKTPLSLSEKVATDFNQYTKHHEAAAFAVTLDGNGRFWTRCRYQVCTYDRGKSAAVYVVEKCKEFYKKECKLFALKKDIVWEGTVEFPEANSDEHILKIKYTGTSRNINADEKWRHWEQTGKATLDEEGNFANLSIFLKGTWCFGKADFTTEKWSLDCPTDKIYEGTIRPSKVSKYWGTANDIDMTILILEKTFTR